MRSLGLCIALCACGARTELSGRTTVDASVDFAVESPSTCHDEAIATDARGATALALDGDVVFWATTDGLLRTRDASGTTTTLSTGNDARAIVVDAVNLYYLTTASLRSMPRVGGPSTQLAMNFGPTPFALVRADRLFWVDDGGLITSIRSVNTDGTDPTMLDVGNCRGLAVDPTYVYLDQYFPGLSRMQHDGSNRVVLAAPAGHDAQTTITLFGGRVYWIEHGAGVSSSVRSIDVNGGTPTLEMQTDGYAYRELAVDESGVYVTALTQTGGALLHDGTEIASTPNARYESVRTSATAIYWTIDWYEPAPSDGASVRKLCK